MIGNEDAANGLCSWFSAADYCIWFTAIWVTSKEAEQEAEQGAEQEAEQGAVQEGEEGNVGEKKWVGRGSNPRQQD